MVRFCFFPLGRPTCTSRRNCSAVLSCLGRLGCTSKTQRARNHPTKTQGTSKATMPPSPPPASDDALEPPAAAAAAAAGGPADQPPAVAAAVGGRSLPLYSPIDPEHLSPLVCLMRSQLELFSATSADVAERAAIGGISQQITPGRVGIRCVHCKGRGAGPVAGTVETRPTRTAGSTPQAPQAKGSTSYPTSLRILHQVSERDVFYLAEFVLSCSFPSGVLTASFFLIHTIGRVGLIRLPSITKINRPSGTGRVSCDTRYSWRERYLYRLLYPYSLLPS